MKIEEVLSKAWDDTKALHTFVSLTHASFANMSEAGRLIRVAKEAVHGLTPADKRIDYNADEHSVVAMENMSASCRAVLAEGLPHLYQMATISLWAILEATADDLCVSYIPGRGSVDDGGGSAVD